MKITQTLPFAIVYGLIMALFASIVADIFLPKYKLLTFIGIYLAGLLLAESIGWTQIPSNTEQESQN